MTLKTVCLCIWWDISETIHYELLKPGEKITAEVYFEQLYRINAELTKKSTMVKSQRHILQHDSSRSHSAKVTQEKIKEN
jgi:hypothetical protein